MKHCKMVRFLICMGIFSLVAAALWAGGGTEDSKTITPQEMVTDPATGMKISAPEYGGTLTIPINTVGLQAFDQSVSTETFGVTPLVLEDLVIGDWGISRDIYDFSGTNLPMSAVTGRLAESWELVDSTTLVVKIKEGVHWQDKEPMNGRLMTPEDIVFNYHRALGLGSGFTEPAPTYAESLLAEIGIKKISVGDNHSVVFELEAPKIGVIHTIFFPGRPGYAVYPPEVIEEYGYIDSWDKLIGTGPYMITDWLEGSSYTATKHQNYHGYDEKFPDNQLPYFDEVRVLIMAEVATRVAAIRSRKIDFLAPFGASAIRSVDQIEALSKSNPELQIWPMAARSDTASFMNQHREPYNDIRVRHALQMALNLPEINELYWKGWGDITPQGSLASSLVEYTVPFDKWPKELQGYYSYDKDGAEAMLDEAGYPRGADGTRFKTVYTALDLWDTGFVELMAGYWEQIGIDVEIEVVDDATLGGIIAEGSFDVPTYDMGPGFLAVDRLGAIPWVMGQYLSDSDYNFVGTFIPEYDALYEKAMAATTLEGQQAAWREAFMFTIEQHHQIWGGVLPIYLVAQPWITGYNGEQFGAPLLARLWTNSALKAEY